MRVHSKLKSSGRLLILYLLFKLGARLALHLSARLISGAFLHFLPFLAPDLPGARACLQLAFNLHRLEAMQQKELIAQQALEAQVGGTR